MGERTLLSGSDGTFWSVQSGNEWKKLLLTECTNFRTGTLGTTTVDVNPVQVVSAFSDDGFVNTVTIEDVLANISTGSSSVIANRAATYFGFPIIKPDGSQLDLSEQFTIDFFFELTEDPDNGSAQNKCMFIMGINDGQSDLSTGRAGGGFRFDQSTAGANPRIFNYGGGAGLSFANCNNLRYITFTYRTTPEDNISVFQDTVVRGYGDDNVLINQRQTSKSNNYYMASPTPGSRPTGPAHVFLSFGKNGTGGSGATGARTFKFKAYYSFYEHTFNGVSSFRPG
tara:strand:- start:24 stop:875 length:852 start_codon:yes stop_codon:yes gene_type:complete